MAIRRMRRVYASSQRQESLHLHQNTLLRQPNHAALRIEWCVDAWDRRNRAILTTAKVQPMNLCLHKTWGREKKRVTSQKITIIMIVTMIAGRVFKVRQQTKRFN